MNPTPPSKVVAICEDYVGNNIQIKDLAIKYDLNQNLVALILTNYMGKKNKLKSFLSKHRYDYYNRITTYTSNNLTIYEQDKN